MSFQPPPPPPSDNPPPPPPPASEQPGQWAPPPAAHRPPARSTFDPKTVNPLDWAILGLGALLLIFSFFDYYSLSAGPVSDSASAWHMSDGSFLAWFAMAFGVLGAAALAAELFTPQVRLPQPARLVSLGLFALSSLFYILAIFIHPKFFDAGGISFGHGFSFWFSLVLALVGTVLALMRLQQTGGQLPGAFSRVPNIGQRFPQSGPPTS